MLSKVYLRLTTGKQENLNLRDFNITKFNDNQNSSYDKKIFSAPRERLMHLTENEKIQHDCFINEMKDPIWKKIR